MQTPCSENVFEWIAAKVDGGLSDAEAAELEAFLTEHPDAQALVEKAVDAHREIAAAFEKAKPDAELESRVLQHFLQTTSKQPQDFLLKRKEPDSFWRRVLMIAVPSTVMLFLGMGLSRMVIGDDRPVWKRPSELEQKKEGMELGMPGAEPGQTTTGKDAPLPSDPTSRIDELLRRRKGFRDAEFKIEVASWSGAEGVVSQAIQEAQGEVEISRSDRMPSGMMKVEIVARVPRKELDTFSKGMSAVGEVRSQRAETPDDTFTEAEARLKLLQEAESQLKALLAKSGSDADTAASLELELADLRHEIEQVRLALTQWTVLRDTASVALSVQEADPSQPAYRLDETIQMTLLTPAVRRTFDAVKAMAGLQVLEARLVQDEEGKESAIIDLQVDPEKAGALLEEVAKLGRLRNLDRKNTRMAVNAGSAMAKGDIKAAPIRMRIRIQLDDREERNLMLSLYSDRVESVCETIKREVTAAGGVVLATTVSGAGTPGASASLRARLYSDREAAAMESIRKLGYRSTLDITRDSSTPGEVFPVAVEMNIRSQESPVRQTALQMEAADIQASARLVQEAASAGGFNVRRSSFEFANGAGKATLILSGPDSGVGQMIDKLNQLGKFTQVSAKGEQRDLESKDAIAEVEVRLIPAKPERKVESFGSALSRNLQEGFRSFGGVAKSLALGAVYVLPWGVLAFGLVWLLKRAVRRK